MHIVGNTNEATEKQDTKDTSIVSLGSLPSEKGYHIDTPALGKKHTFVIIGFGNLGKGRHQILTDAGQNVYVCSLNGRKYTDAYSLEHHVHSYNAFDLPIQLQEIDAVLVCCTATDIGLLNACLPKKLLKEKGNRFVFFQNGIGIREKIKRILTNTQHPTQVVPYFSFKTNEGQKVDIAFAKTCPTTGDTHTISLLTEALNTGPHQSDWFEGVDSIVITKAERKKGYVNAFLNTVAVLYKLPTKDAVDAFVHEYGDDAKDRIYQELVTYNNDIAGNDLLHMEKKEIQEDIENAIEKFGSKYPSTYNQYYNLPLLRGKIRSDESEFIGTIIDIAAMKKAPLPLLETLYMRLMTLKEKLQKERYI